MNEDNNRMDENRLDDTFENSLPDIPPDDIADMVSPWSNAWDYIIVGEVLTTFVLNIWIFGYIFKMLGSVLMLLGFRKLRRENVFFKFAYMLSAVSLAFNFLYACMNATVFASAAVTSARIKWLWLIAGVVTLGIITLQRAGLAAVFKKSGADGSLAAATSLILYYAAIFLLGMIRFEGTVTVIVLIVFYIVGVYNFVKLVKVPDRAGYAVDTAPVRISDRGVVLSVTAALTVGILCGYVFFNSYPVKWNDFVPTTDSEVVQIKSHLEALGFPSDILKDIDDEDIRACAGAVRVVVEERDYPLNEGRDAVTQREENGQTVVSHSKAYDKQELHLINIAVETEEDLETYRIFRCFRYNERPAVCTTEAIILQPLYNSQSQYFMKHNVYWTAGGRLLCERDGKTYTADYYYLGDDTVTDPFVSAFNKRILAEFSIPDNADNFRGYIAYSAKLDYRNLSMIYDRLQYNHQVSRLVYPVMTASEQAHESWRNSYAFKSVDDRFSVERREENIKTYGH